MRLKELLDEALQSQRNLLQEKEEIEQQIRDSARSAARAADINKGADGQQLPSVSPADLVTKQLRERIEQLKIQLHNRNRIISLVLKIYICVYFV